MRYKEIDIFKGLLTVQMILAHCLQFFTQLRPGSGEHIVSEYINLTTFSGFIFAFGFVTWHAYLTKPFGQVWKRILKNVLRMLAAYYISAFAYVILVDGITASSSRVWDILFFRDLGGWSEFLLSFAGLLLLVLLFFSLMKKAGKWLPLIIAGIALGCAFIPVFHENALLALFIGGVDYPVFAVLPYSVYFAAGIWFAQKEVGLDWKAGVVALVGTGLFFGVWLFTEMPSRFPLSLPWLVGAALFLYAYYLLSRFLARIRFTSGLQDMGSNSLFYLLVSNLLIFSVISSSFFRLKVDFALGFFVAVLAITLFLRYLFPSGKIKRKTGAGRNAA